MRKVFPGILGFLLLFAWPLHAQYRASRSYQPPLMTWDIGGGFGAYGSYSYSELDLGLNYRFLRPFAWRNMVWDRFANSPVSAAGVDSSLRYEYFQSSSENGKGFYFFAGPGLRLATNNFSGYFAELGLIVRTGGLNIGGGVKVINYASPSKDPNSGATLPTQDTVIFIILGGGGAL